VHTSKIYITTGMFTQCHTEALPRKVGISRLKSNSVILKRRPTLTMIIWSRESHYWSLSLTHRQSLYSSSFSPDFFILLKSLFLDDNTAHKEWRELGFEKSKYNRNKMSIDPFGIQEGRLSWSKKPVPNTASLTIIGKNICHLTNDTNSLGRKDCRGKRKILLRSMKLPLEILLQKIIYCYLFQIGPGKKP